MTEDEMFEIAQEASSSMKNTSRGGKSKKSVSFKKLSEEERREQIRQGLLKKKESERQILMLVERLLECPIDPIWFKRDALPALNVSYYTDVVEERCLLRLCGYPICSQSLPKNIPLQKYRIALSQKKVYDLTERKKFCSKACFNASTYILQQMDNEPLWMREAPCFKSKRTIKLLRHHKNELGSEVSLSNGEPRDIGDKRSFEDPNSHEEVLEDELEMELEALPDVDQLFQSMNIKPEALPNVDELFLAMNIKAEAPPSPQKEHLIVIKPKKVRPPSSSDIISSRLKDWCTIQTLRYLQGDDYVLTVLSEHRYGPDRILSLLGTAPNLSPDSLASYNKLVGSTIVNKDEHQDDNLKIMAFLQGKTEICPEEGHSSDRSLPQVFSRRKVVWDQLDSVLPEVLSLFGLQFSDVDQDVSALIGGFHLTPSNIVLSKPEWTLLSLAILEMIREKNVRLRTLLKSREAKKYLNMILLNFDMEEKGLSSIVTNAVADIHLLVNKGAFDNL